LILPFKTHFVRSRSAAAALTPGDKDGRSGEAFSNKSGNTHTGAFFPTGEIGGRLGRHSEGAQKDAPSKKTTKKIFFFFAGQFFFAPPSISPTNILTFKK